LERRGLKADAYNSAANFLNNLYKYSKDTKIITDHELKQGGNGFDLLKKLHEQGYSKLYLLSGRSFEKQEIPSYITVLLKNAKAGEKLVNA
jgi:FixJ family two-component response regulator